MTETTVGKRLGRRAGRVLTAPFRALWAIPTQPRNSIPTILATVLYVLCYQPFVVYPLIFVWMVPFFWMLEAQERPSRAFLWSWLHGTLVIAFGFYFIYTLVVVFGGLPWFVAAPIQLLFSLYQGILFAIFGGLYCWARQRGLPAAVVAPTVYVAVEYLVGFVLIFPYSQAQSPYPFLAFIQVADLGGGPLLTGLILMTNITLFLWTRWWWLRRKGEGTARPVRLTAVTVALLAATLVYGVVRIGQVDAVVAESPHIRVGLVEADLGIGYKGTTPMENLRTHQMYSQQLERDGAELILWPETSVNTHQFVASMEPTQDLETLRETAVLLRGALRRDVTWFAPSDAPLVLDPSRDPHRPPRHTADYYAVQRGFSAPLLFGVLTAREPTADELQSIPVHPFAGQRVAFNTAVLIDGEGRVLGSYDKLVLLAFGETVPGSHWLYEHLGFNFFDLIPTAGDIFPGDGPSVLELPLEREGQDPVTVRLGGMVCYEDLIAWRARSLARLGPNVFVNVINDGWFEESTAAYHHMAFSVLRSVEHRLTQVRASNTGVSSFTDPVGRIRHHTEVTEPEILIDDVPIMPPPATVYTALGDVVAYLAIAGLCAIVVIGRRRKPGATAV